MPMTCLLPVLAVAVAGAHIARSARLTVGRAPKRSVLLPRNLVPSGRLSGGLVSKRPAPSLVLVGVLAVRRAASANPGAGAGAGGRVAVANAGGRRAVGTVGAVGAGRGVVVRLGVGSGGGLGAGNVAVLLGLALGDLGGVVGDLAGKLSVSEGFG